MRVLPLAFVLTVVFVGRAGTSVGQARRSDADATRFEAPAARSAQSTVSVAPGQLLIFFKRVVGADPLSSQLIVDRDGRASALVTNGGPGGEHRQDFRVGSPQLRRLRTLVATTPLHDTSCCDPNFYTYFVSTGGHSWRLDQEHLAARERPLIDALDAITDAHTSYNGPSG